MHESFGAIPPSGLPVCIFKFLLAHLVLWSEYFSPQNRMNKSEQEKISVRKAS